MDTISRKCRRIIGNTSRKDCCCPNERTIRPTHDNEGIPGDSMTPLPTILFRTDTGPTGTFGRLFVAGQWFHSLEPPWRANRRNVSCIPAGRYDAVPYHSPRFGDTYLISQVPGRSGILFHAGNWAGDESEGYRTSSQGCILLGLEREEVLGQDGVRNSGLAIDHFMRITDGRLLKMWIISLAGAMKPGEGNATETLG